MHHIKFNMKTGTIFVLVAFIVRGLEVAYTARPTFGGEVAEGILPESREGTEPSVRPGDGLARKLPCPHCRVEIQP